MREKERGGEADLLRRYGVELGVAEEGEPVGLAGTHRGEDKRGRELVAVAEHLHQAPALLSLQTTAAAGWGGGGGGGRGEEGRREGGREGGEGGGYSYI